jgi:uncharacterized protein YecE (DUF72 family)
MIGTSGWYYDEWVGPFYDRKKGMFTRYAKVFGTAEVNSTFYRYPSTRTVQGWYRNAPPGFIFSLKLPQLITHEKWLSLEKGVEDDTHRFIDLIRPLAEKTGPILIQLRPKFNFDEHADALESYLEILPGNYEWAVEFRNHSWLRPETYEILERNNVAYTIVDEPLLPPEIHVTAEFAYIRWHGHGTRPWYNYEYTPGELESWIPKVEETTRKARKTYGYFNNHFSANAVKNAVEMLRMLNRETPEQSAALKKIVEHRVQETKLKGVQTLEAFAVEEDGLSVADHIVRFTTTSRLSRGEKIDDGELTINANSGDRVQAEIRDYFIDIDADARVIRHDCDDWRKGADQRRLCKHVVKLFLSLPPGQAKQMLADMLENRHGWAFEAA